MDELELIRKVTDKIAGGISVEEVLRSIIDGATEFLRARRGSIMLVDPPTQELRIRVARGVPEEVVRAARVKVGEGISGSVAAKGEPVLLTGLSGAGRSDPRDLRGYRDGSAICVPLKIRGEVLGVLNLNDREQGSFSESDLRVASLVATQAAVALYNAKLVQEAREKERIESALAELTHRESRLRERASALDLVVLITEKLVASPQLAEVLDSLIRESTALVKAQRGSILLHDPREGVLKIAASRGFPPEVVDRVRIAPGEGLAGRVFAEGEPLLLSNLDGSSREGSPHGSYTTSSAMIVPLKMKGECLGVVNLSNKELGLEFTQDDFLLARIVANQASIAVSNAQLAASWLENQKMRQALEIAREIQRRFLPQEAPSVDRLEIAGWSVACDEIGGDYYDYIQISDREVAVAIGDVSGHGIGAALLMASGRAFLRALAIESDDLAQMLFRVNNLLAADTRDDSFMTLFLGAFDLEHRRLRYTSAGHDEPIHYRPSTGEHWDLESTGIPLGMMAGQEFPIAQIGSIEPGDIFVFSTDGVWEARNEHAEAFGRERFLASLAANSAKPPEEIIRAIHGEVLSFCGGVRPHDDVSLVVARVL